MCVCVCVCVCGCIYIIYNVGDLVQSCTPHHHHHRQLRHRGYEGLIIGMTTDADGRDMLDFAANGANEVLPTVEGFRHIVIYSIDLYVSLSLDIS